MRHRAVAGALLLAVISMAGPSSALGTGHGASGHAAGAAHGFSAIHAHSLQTASFSAHSAPHPAASTLVTRPAHPPHPAFGGFARHHRHHGDVFFFGGPPFFAPFFYGYAYPSYAYPFAYPYSDLYPYSYPYSALYDFGTPLAYTAPPYALTTPFFCWIDRIGFTDEERFAHHLHEVHGVPLDAALSASEVVGGRYVFFGF